MLEVAQVAAGQDRLDLTAESGMLKKLTTSCGSCFSDNPYLSIDTVLRLYDIFRSAVRARSGGGE